MAKLRGTGMAAVNYPTGMNLGGDPSQALVHATTSGSFVVDALGHRPRPGAPDGDRPDRRRDARGRRTTRSSSTPPTPTPGPHDMGTFASRATHRVGNAVIAGRDRGPRGACSSSRPRSSRRPSSDLVLDGARQRPGRGRARPLADGSPTSRRAPSSSTAGRSRAAAPS